MDNIVDNVVDSQSQGIVLFQKNCVLVKSLEMGYSCGHMKSYHRDWQYIAFLHVHVYLCSRLLKPQMWIIDGNEL